MLLGLDGWAGKSMQNKNTVIEGIVAHKVSKPK